MKQENLIKIPWFGMKDSPKLYYDKTYDEIKDTELKDEADNLYVSYTGDEFKTLKNYMLTDWGIEIDSAKLIYIDREKNKYSFAIKTYWELATIEEYESIFEFFRKHANNEDFEAEVMNIELGPSVDEEGYAYITVYIDIVEF